MLKTLLKTLCWGLRLFFRRRRLYQFVIQRRPIHSHFFAHASP